MITGLIHKGSGIGDQLFSYIATRVRAADLGVDYGLVGKEFFKGASFMDLDWGKEINTSFHLQPQSGAVILDSIELALKTYELDKPYYDPEFNFIPDGSIIDGYGAQDIRYFEHRLDEVREWLKVEPLEMKDDKCVINFRGGEYAGVPDLFLTKEYWNKAVNMVNDTYKSYEIHTDDPVLARKFFPHWEIVHDIALNWRSIRYAPYLIISNSAFAIIPALLNENAKKIIAPRYWAGRNVGEWRRPGNYYKKFIYI